MFVDSPTEQTTAITDLVLALQALAAILVLRRSPERRPMWTDVWIWCFGLLCFASVFGAISHGIRMTSATQNALWVPIYLALGLMMALFAIAAVTMAWNHDLAKRCLPCGAAVAIGFFATTQIWTDSFLLFVIYEAISMLLALILYTACFWLRREQGSGFLAAGILVGIVAAILDTQTTVKFTMIWTFNNHGVFHLAQMLSLLLLTVGVYSSHRLVSTEQVTV